MNRYFTLGIILIVNMLLFASCEITEEKAMPARLKEEQRQEALRAEHKRAKREEFLASRQRSDAPQQSVEIAPQAENQMKSASSAPRVTNDYADPEAGPEWINGIWKLNTVISTRLGTMRVNATLCIDRKSRQLVATEGGSSLCKGSYYVDGNTIHCGNTYFKLDNYSQRIDFGDGNYFEKVSNTYL